MEEVLSDFVGWVSELRPVWAYLAILGVAYVENLLPPIPGDLVVVFGGYLAFMGQLDLTLVVFVAALGGTAGFMTMYAIGSHIGEAVMDPDRLRYIPKVRVARARAWLRRWGYGLVVSNRFLSGARSVISLTVGMAHMKAGKTTLLAAISALVWTAVIAYLGYLLGENWSDVQGYIGEYSRVLLVLVAAFILFQVLRAVRVRKPQEPKKMNETGPGEFMHD